VAPWRINQAWARRRAPASLAAVDVAVREDRNVYPDEAMLAASFVASTPPREIERARSRLWSRFKAGR
jgi:putrescine transport system substrate-binding protein